MALIVAVKKGDVFSWRGTAELIDDIRRTFAEHTASLVDGERVELLTGLREEISAEIHFDESLAGRMGELLGEVDTADNTERLKALPRRCDQLVAEHFERRGSAIAVHEISTRFFDRLFLKIVGLATSEPELEGLQWCWLLAEEAGRGEMTTLSGHRHFLVYDDRLSHVADRFVELSRRVGAALADLGIMSEPKSGPNGDAIWCGSSGEWQAWLQAALTPPEQYAVLPALPALAAPFRHADRGAGFLDHFAAVADLRLVAGHGETGRLALSQAQEALGRLPLSTAFAQAARQIAAMPVALNLFGWFRVERSGKHRGEFDIETHALNPLVMNIRLLGVTHGISATGTIERVRALLAGGHLNVETAEKVVRACHEISRQKVRTEVRRQRDEGLFLNPEEMSDAEGQKFKAALETVVALERLVHSQFMEKM